LKTILLNNGTRDEGKNLYTCLAYFGVNNANIARPWLWIDQICIDQDTLTEKNHQVQMMSDIYYNCEHVMVWLGCDKVIIEAAKAFTSKRLSIFGLKRRAEEKRILAAESIGEHRYFKRLWIVQELLLAPKIRVLIGSKWIVWCELRMSYFALHLHSGSAVGLLNDTILRRQHMLGTLLYRYCRQDCRDERDKIYGLQGLVPQEDCVEVDYAKSIIEVYVDALTATLKGQGVSYETGISHCSLMGSILAQNIGFTEEMG
jgi:hypothetical protein